MGEFKGFDKDTLFLLAENKFLDSKEHYESVKQSLKHKAIDPMRQICSDLSEQLLAIDSKMNLIPSKMVSRIRRDTRFTNNKQLYRDNVWAMFMRNKHDWQNQPCMWFEYTQLGYSMGVGIFDCTPRIMEFYRSEMLKNQDEFRKAVKSCLDFGAVLDTQRYKRNKPGDIAPDLEAFYNAKYLYFIYFSDDFSDMYSTKVLDKLRQGIDAFAPMYKFLLKPMEKAISAKDKTYE